MLNIILTSYNRPFFVRHTLASLISQTDPRWRCYLMDDASNAETLAAIAEFNDSRINLQISTGEIDRAATRYGILINTVLPKLTSGVVGYLCDNVEYKPTLVAEVLGFFEEHPKAFCGYVLHERDAWTTHGHRIGPADRLGHWNITPPTALHGLALDGDVSGVLDHSQVFHRLPVALRWPEAAELKQMGDGDYFTRLNYHYGPIYPINTDQPLTLEHLFS